MKLWISRQRNGEYMMTALKPVLKRVGLQPYSDYYLRYGEPVGLRGICENGFLAFSGLKEHLPIYGQIKMDITAKILEDFEQDAIPNKDSSTEIK